MLIESYLSDQEANFCILEEKHYEDDLQYRFPIGGQKLTIPIISVLTKREYILDVSRGKIELLKVKYQTRVSSNIILLRLDLNSQPHRNPDDAKIGETHIHIYKEGYADKWAYDLPDSFRSLNGNLELLNAFMDFCNITVKPIINEGMFDGNE